MEGSSKRGVLFANGELTAPDIISEHIKHDDFLIAVDGGLAHLITLNLKPDLIIGDLDSADPSQVAKFRTSGVPIRQFPTQKDETDLELAIAAALDMGITSLRLIAALGGRLDQTLANIFLMTQPNLKECDLRLIDHHQEVFVIHEEALLQGESGQRVSLLPLNGPAVGVRTKGLVYPLNEETLYPYESRGISNRMETNHAEVSLKNGQLLCIHETKKSEQKE